MSVLIVNPPGTLAIGSAIGSGTSGSVLFLDSSGNLAQDNPAFTWNATNNTLKIRSDGSNNLQEWQTSAGVAGLYVDSSQQLTVRSGNSLVLYRTDNLSSGQIFFGDVGDGNRLNISSSLRIAGTVQFDTPIITGNGFTLRTSTGNPVTIAAAVNNSSQASAGVIVDTYTTTATLSPLLSIRNAGTERAYFGPNGELTIATSQAGTIPFTVKAASSQTVNIAEWQDNSTNILLNIDPAGRVRFQTATSGSTNEGSLWTDSTQKALQAFVDGIEQTLSGTVFTQTADKSVTNTVTETSIVGTGVGTLTLPANFWVIGKTVRITMSGVYSTVAVTGDTVTIKVKYGSTVLASKATSSLLTGASNLAWFSEILVTCRTTGATGTVQVSGGVIYQVASSATVEDELNNGVSTTTLDTTASGLFDVSVTHSAANASNTVKSLVCAVEVLN